MTGVRLALTFIRDDALPQQHQDRQQGDTHRYAVTNGERRVDTSFSYPIRIKSTPYRQPQQCTDTSDRVARSTEAVV